jgi:hypothetical protein
MTFVDIDSAAVELYNTNVCHMDRLLLHLGMAGLSAYGVVKRTDRLLNIIVAYQKP